MLSQTHAELYKLCMPAANEPNRIYTYIASHNRADQRDNARKVYSTDMAQGWVYIESGAKHSSGSLKQ